MKTNVSQLVLIVFILSYHFSFAQIVKSNSLNKIEKIDAIQNDSIALVSLEKLNDKSTVKERLEINWRIILRANSLQKFEKTIKIGNESVLLAHNNNLDSLEAYFNKLLGNSYYYMDRKRAAVPYYKKALNIALDNDYWELAANCNNNIGGALTDVQEYKMAEPYLLNSISIMIAHGKENELSTLKTYRVLARFYSESGQNQKSEELYLTLITKSKEIKNNELLSESLLFYSEILSKRKKFEEAIKMSGEALQIIRKGKDPHLVQMALTIHSLNLSLAGKYKEAYELSDESKYLLRNTFANDLEKEVGELEVKYKTAQLQRDKELSILKNKKQKQVYIFTFIGIFIIGGAGIYIWNQRKNSNQKILLSNELAEASKLRFKEVIEAEEKERLRIAQELHDSLGQMLSIARLNVAGLEDAVDNDSKDDLARSLSIIDEACNEVRSISHAMLPSTLIRLGLISTLNELVSTINSSKSIRIDFKTNVNSVLDKTLEINIYRIVQEVLNNMIKHAKADLITMNIEKIDSNLAITIKDNGIGFDLEEINKSKGIGWKNIYSRVQMLNGNIKLESELQEGTTIYINLNLDNGE